jgi:hypothetical protein
LVGELSVTGVLYHYQTIFLELLYFFLTKMDSDALIFGREKGSKMLQKSPKGSIQFQNVRRSGFKTQAELVGFGAEGGRRGEGVIGEWHFLHTFR